MPSRPLVVVSTVLMLAQSVTRGDLFIAGEDFFGGPRIARYDETTGASIGIYQNGGELIAGIGVGPDHELYAAFDFFGQGGLYRATGPNKGYVVFGGPPNGWTFPGDVTFGPDGNAYVNSNYNGFYGSRSIQGVLKYKTDGTFLGKFADTSGSRLTFGPNGDLFVLTGYYPSGDIHRFRGSDGLDLGVFLAVGSGGLTSPQGFEFGPDGNLYIVSSGDRILRFDGSTGAFIDTFVAPGAGGLQGATDLAFGPDGNLDVCMSKLPTGSMATTVLKYSGSTGAFLGTLVPPTFADNTKGLEQGVYMTFGYVPEPSAVSVVTLVGFASIRRHKRC